jgi:putative transcriptional regulator
LKEFLLKEMELDIDFFKVEHNRISPKVGRILISEPGLIDQYFKRSVILIVEHNDKGTVGFVLNRLIELNPHELMPDFPNFPSLVSIGGPVSPNSIHFIHTVGDIIPDTIQVAEGLYWGGDFEAVKALINQNKITPRQIRFFVGYSGWGKNQLNKELKEGSWVVSELDIVQIMAAKEDLWSRIVAQMGPKYKSWTLYPENPSLN